MKYKIGDKVVIKSLDWYNDNKDSNGEVYNHNPYMFIDCMKKYCGKEATIVSIQHGCYSYYKIDIDNQEWLWIDFMFEDKNG